MSSSPPTTTTTATTATPATPAPSATTAPPPHVKPTKTLACVHCQYRKIKCDRQQPCSNCIKAKVTCKPSTPAAPHKRRRPNQDLLERLARCEQLLKQYAGGNIPPGADVNPAATKSASPLTGSNSQLSSPPTIKLEAGPNSASTPPGKVIEEDGNVRFMDNSVRLSFHDELIAMRNIIDDDDQESESSPAGLSPESSSDLFLGVDSDTTIDLQELQPNLVNVFRLWQIFVDRVNPLTKIVHIPSLQPYVLDAAADINKVPLPYQALIFSIYTMGVVPLSDQEVVQHFGISRVEALNRFMKGTKLALTRSNFLKNYNMTILQALSFYMLALHGRNDHHSNWIMGGTVLRIAQKMGYHRDGENFNFDPFETEMRRRLWWHVLTADSKNAMLSGLSQSWTPTNWDTKLPLNLNDSDMVPNLMEPFVPRDGPTEMAFVLLIYQYQQFTHSTHSVFEAAFSSLRDGGKANLKQARQASQSAMETYRALVNGLDLKLAEFEQKYVDQAAGGVQEAASMVRPLFVGKMRNIMTPMREQPEWGIEIFDPIDSIFKSFIQNQIQNAPIYRRLAQSGFLWYMKGAFPLDALLTFTARLYQRPTGQLTDRAWAALELLHELHPDLFDISQKKIDRQAQFTLKAWAIREQALAQCGQKAEVPGFIHRLRQLSSSRANSSFSTSSGSPASATQQFAIPQTQTSPFQSFGLDTVDATYLAPNPDATNFNVDMWGNLTLDVDTELQQQTVSYEGFDFSKLDFSPQDFMG